MNETVNLIRRIFIDSKAPIFDVEVARDKNEVLHILAITAPNDKGLFREYVEEIRKRIGDELEEECYVLWKAKKEK